MLAFGYFLNLNDIAFKFFFIYSFDFSGKTDKLKICHVQVVFHCQVDHSCMVSSIKWFHTTQDNYTRTLVKVTQLDHPAQEGPGPVTPITTEQSL